MTAGVPQSPLSRFATILVGCALLGATGPGAAFASTPTGNTEMLDFNELQRPSSPNTWLVAPAAGAGWAPPDADARAPIFDMPAGRLAERWQELVTGQERSEVLGVSPDGLQVEAEQRSAVFGFVDRVSFRAVPIGEGRSTFAAYSRSQVGYWDLGANRRRLQSWIAELVRDVGRDGGSR